MGKKRGKSRSRSKSRKGGKKGKKKSLSKKRGASAAHRKSSTAAGARHRGDEFHLSAKSKICVLRHGESMVLSKNVTELEIILYRPLEPPPPPDPTPEPSVSSSKKNVETGSDEDGGGDSRHHHHHRSQNSKKGSNSKDRHSNNNTTSANNINNNNRHSSSTTPPQEGGGAAAAESPILVNSGGDGAAAAEENYAASTAATTTTNKLTGAAADPKLSTRPESRADGRGLEEATTTAAAPSAAPLPPPHPWFFDTTACVFVDPKNLSKANYVATGRTATDNKDLAHLPHAVVTGKEPGAHGNHLRLNLNVSQSDNTFSDLHLGLMMSLGGLGESFSSRAGQLMGSTAVLGLMGGLAGLVSPPPSKPPLNIAPLAVTNGPLIMAAADGVRLHLKHLQTCAGALISCSLFDKMQQVPQPNWGVYFLIRSKGAAIPICLVPVQVIQERCTSQISIMLRRIRVQHEIVWELVSMAEALHSTDVPGVLLSMQQRGLKDVEGYNPDYRTPRESDEDEDDHHDGSYDGAGHNNYNHNNEDDPHKKREEYYLGRRRHHHRGPGNGSVSSSDSDILDEDSEEEWSDTAQESDGDPSHHHHHRDPHSVSDESEGCRTPVEFEQLLAKLPLVVREGRRQYSEGLTNVNSMLNEDAHSGEDEVMDDALKAVVPRFAHGHPVRYANSTYNYGSNPISLSTHYSGYRDAYAVETAAANPNKLPSIYRRSTIPVNRCCYLRADGSGMAVEEEGEDPLLPPWDVILTPVPSSRRRSSGSSSRKGKKKGKKKSKKKKSKKKSKSKSRSRSRSARSA